METFFLDLDGSLKTDVDWKAKGEYETYISPKSGRGYDYIIRPNVREFILGLRELEGNNCNVCILTLSSQPYAEYFVDRMGITDIVDEVYGRERFEDLPNVVSYVLVENDIGIARGKENLIEGSGIVFKRETIIIPTYEGGGDDILVKLLEKIRLKKSFENYKK